MGRWSYVEERKLEKVRRRMLKWADAMSRRRDKTDKEDLPEINEAEARSFKALLSVYKALIADHGASDASHLVVDLREIPTHELLRIGKAAHGTPVGTPDEKDAE